MMGIVAQAKFFLNAYYVLQRHEQALHEEQRIRAKQGFKEHSGKLADRRFICLETDEHIGLTDFVCLAFALELYLKALLEALGLAGVKGHSIKTLFEKLPLEVQAKVFNIHMRSTYGLTLDDYKSRMGDVDNGFEQFRYAHEYKSLEYHQTFALSMIEALKQMISEVRDL